MLNSRMKDYFDLRILAKHSDFDGAVLSRAIKATFERRSTDIPNGVPIGLADEFVNDSEKEKQWQAFLRKNAMNQTPLRAVVDDLNAFLMPILNTLVAGGNYNRPWHAGQGWKMPLAQSG